VQVVTSAFRRLNPEWAKYKRFHVSVSVDGLAEDHDARRAPATYERILKNIEGHKVTVHCTVTSQQMRRAGYLEEFVSFWSAQEAVERIWFSLFTPQRDADLPEILSERQRKQAVDELLELRLRYAKLAMPPALLREFLNPPQSPKECIFAMTTRTISADLKTHITPCQLGGDPDCAKCGCMASMALAAVGNHKLAGLIPVSTLFKASFHIGELVNPGPEAEPEPAFRVLQ
jgi:sulfatase maturation enzyme AslB (radical SAM superfamily)